eukprot:3307120-Alexandrium_andersonii.AAC.1
MSASLVGSEMCIRDSPLPPPPAPAQSSPARRRQKRKRHLPGAVRLPPLPPRGSAPAEPSAH